MWDQGLKSIHWLMRLMVDPVAGGVSDLDHEVQERAGKSSTALVKKGSPDHLGARFQAAQAMDQLSPGYLKALLGGGYATLIGVARPLGLAVHKLR